jgi:hypothetical protein
MDHYQFYSVQEPALVSSSIDSVSYTKRSDEAALIPIRGLAISDFWMAINFLSSASMNVAGHNIGDLPQKTFCSFNGFMIQVFVVQSES